MVQVAYTNTPWGANNGKKSVQESLLLGQKTTNGLGRHPPAGIGVTGQGSQPRAGGIDQDPLEGFTPLGALLQKIGGIGSQGIDGGKAKPAALAATRLSRPAERSTAQISA